MISNILNVNSDEFKRGLTNLFNHQNTAHSLILKHHIISYKSNLTAFICKTYLALQSELGEFVDETQFKWWKQPTEINIDNLLYEYTDGILILHSTIHYLNKRLIEDNICTEQYRNLLFYKVLDEFKNREDSIGIPKDAVNKLNLNSLLQVFATYYIKVMSDLLHNYIPVTDLTENLTHAKDTLKDNASLISTEIKSDYTSMAKNYYIQLCIMYFTALDCGFELLELLNVKLDKTYKYVDLFNLMHKKIDVNINRQRGKVNDRLDYIPKE